MVQFNVLSGKLAGTTYLARHFPVRVGRSASANLRLEEPGVWDQHLDVVLDHGRGILLKCTADALATVNAVAVREALLRNGDTIGIGSAKIQFWFAPTRQRTLVFREWFTWGLVAAISLAQVALVYILRAWE